MCVVSLVQEHYTEKWNTPKDWWQQGTIGTVSQPGVITVAPKAPTKEEIAEFQRLLERAREYDKKYSQPDCELETKKQVLREMAKLWNIDISFVDKE